MPFVYDVYASAIVVDTGANAIRMEENGTAFTCTLTAGTYYLALAGSAGGADNFCAHLKARLEASSPGGATYTVTYRVIANPDSSSLTGQITIANTAGDTQVLGSSGITTFDVAQLGFVAGADSAQSSSLVSTRSPSATWLSSMPAPVVDPGGLSASVSQHRTQGGATHTFVNADPVEVRETEVQFEVAARTWYRTANGLATSDPNKSFERFWRRIIDGRTVRLYQAELSGTTAEAIVSTEIVGDFVLVDPLTEWRPARDSDVPTYAWRLGWREYVA